MCLQFKVEHFGGKQRGFLGARTPYLFGRAAFKQSHIYTRNLALQSVPFYTSTSSHTSTIPPSWLVNLWNNRNRCIHKNWRLIHYVSGMPFMAPKKTMRTPLVLSEQPQTTTNSREETKKTRGRIILVDQSSLLHAWSIRIECCLFRLSRCWSRCSTAEASTHTVGSWCSANLTTSHSNVRISTLFLHTI